MVRGINEWMMGEGRLWWRSGIGGGGKMEDK